MFYGGQEDLRSGRWLGRETGHNKEVRARATILDRAALRPPPRPYNAGKVVARSRDP